jgi:hypothetical protein
MSDKKFEVIQFNRDVKKEDPPMLWTVIFNDGTMTEITADIMDPEYLPFMLFAKKSTDDKYDIVHSVNFDQVKEMRVS